MHRHVRWRSVLGIGACALATVIATPEASESQLVSRTGTWQFSVPINFVGGGVIDGEEHQTST